MLDDEDLKRATARYGDVYAVDEEVVDTIRLRWLVLTAAMLLMISVRCFCSVVRSGPW